MDLKTEKQLLIQKNMENYWKLTAETSHVSFKFSKNHVSTYSTMPDALLNSVLSVQYNSKSDNELLKTIDSSYADKNLSYCFWVFPNENAKLLSDQLTANGLHFDEAMEGMAMMNLGSIDYQFKMPDNVCIKLVQCNEELDDWIKPLTISFNLTEEGSRGYKNIFKYLSKRPNKIHHYIIISLISIIILYLHVLFF